MKAVYRNSFIALAAIALLLAAIFGALFFPAPAAAEDLAAGDYMVKSGSTLVLRNISDAGNPLYCAYDAACPVEASRSVSLEVENDGLGTARCPECGAVFNLSANGTRSDGLGGEILRSYKVTLAGDNLRVQN